MGVTANCIKLLERNITGVKTCIELGAQYLYDTNEHLKDIENNTPTFAKEWFIGKGISHVSIDLNGEGDYIGNIEMAIYTTGANNKAQNVIGIFWNDPGFLPVDLVTDFGTIEHCTDLWGALKNCHHLTKVGGLMIHCNPMVGHWEGHGHHYFTKEFWIELAKLNDYEIVECYEELMYGSKTGGVVYAVLRKLNDNKFNVNT